MKLVILGHENPDFDSIISGMLLENIYRKMYRYKADFIIPDEVLKDTAKLCNKYHVDYRRYQKKYELDEDIHSVLVDHSVDLRNIPSVIMAIDHHPTKQELPYLVKYCHTASTALLIYNMYKNIYKFSKQEINLVVAASYIDTLSLKSTKTTPSDIVECKNLIAKYDLNKDEMYLDGLSITDMSDLKACTLNGLKKYEINNNIVYSSYVQVTEDELNKIPLILKEIPRIMRNKRIDYFVFILTIRHFKPCFKATLVKALLTFKQLLAKSILVKVSLLNPICSFKIPSLTASIILSTSCVPLLFIS